MLSEELSAAGTRRFPSPTHPSHTLQRYGICKTIIMAANDFKAFAASIIGAKKEDETSSVQSSLDETLEEKAKRKVNEYAKVTFDVNKNFDKDCETAIAYAFNYLEARKALADDVKVSESHWNTPDKRYDLSKLIMTACLMNDYMVESGVTPWHGNIRLAMTLRIFTGTYTICFCLCFS